MFLLKIYEILIGYSGQCLQKHSSIGNLQKKSSEKSQHNLWKNTCSRVSFFLFQSCNLKKRLKQKYFLANFSKVFNKNFFKDQFQAAASMTSEFISKDRNIFKADNKATNYFDVFIMLSGHAFTCWTRRVRSLMKSFFIKFQVFPTNRILLITVFL